MNPNPHQPEEMQSLKACPFCGGEAFMQHVDEDYGTCFKVRCVKCEAEGERFYETVRGHDSKPEVAEKRKAAQIKAENDVLSAWNTRSNAHTDALGAALQFYVSICGNTCHQVSRKTAQEMYEQARAALEAWKVG